MLAIHPPTPYTPPMDLNDPHDLSVSNAYDLSGPTFRRQVFALLSPTWVALGFGTPTSFDRPRIDKLIQELFSTHTSLHSSTK